MILAFPPCTYLTNAGARHLYKGGALNQERYEKGIEAKEFFMMFYNADCERIAIENPTPSRIFELPEKTQVIQPWQFGHPFTKRTQLWLKGLPPLQPTEVVEPERTWCPSGSYSKKHGEKHRGMFTTDRAKNRSKTFPGIAKAMAEQWAGDANNKEKENKTMELKIYNPTEDGFIKAIEWNNEEIKKEVSAKVSYYKDLVYTDEQIKDAKADRATLNKFVTALEDKRKEIKKQCLAPYEAFERQMKEIVAIVQEPIALIDAQVKGYEEKQKQDKLEQVKALWDSMDHPAELTFEKVFLDKFLNASTSMKIIENYFNDDITRFNRDMATIEKLPEYSFEAKQVYISTLSINQALDEAHKLSEVAKKKTEYEAEQARLAAEVEAKKQEETVVVGTVTATANIDGQTVPVAEVPVEVPAKQWISFKALLSVEDATALKQFFESRNIEFKAI